MILTKMIEDLAAVADGFYHIWCYKPMCMGKHDKEDLTAVADGFYHIWCDI